MPEVVTVILCVVAPLLHVLFVADEDISVTLPPVQNVVGPLAVMVGMVGGFTVTTTGADVPHGPVVVTV